MSCTAAERQRRRGGNKTKCLRWNQTGRRLHLRWEQEHRKVRKKEKQGKSETFWRRAFRWQ